MLNDVWKQRNQAVFEDKVVAEFVSNIVHRTIERDLKAELLDTIKYAERKDQLWVSAGLCYDLDYRFTTDACCGVFAGKTMTIKQVIYRTDALEQIAKQLGPCIKVRPLYHNKKIFLKIEFWPTD